MSIILKKRKSKKITEIFSLFFFIILLLVPLFFYSLPVWIEGMIVIGLGCIIYILIDSLHRMDTIFMEVNDVFIFYAINGNFVFKKKDIKRVVVEYSFYAKIFDFSIIEVMNKNGILKKIYLPLSNDYEINKIVEKIKMIE